MRVERLLNHPIITPEIDPSIGTNIQGPSLIRVPDWVSSPLGRYYLYFADHKGQYIRLAYADEIIGPWSIHAPGSLQLTESLFPTEPPEKPANHEEIEAARGTTRSMPHSFAFEAVTTHIASPDVHVDEVNRRVVMYYHGLAGYAFQATRVATSSDGLRFEPREPLLGKSYFRVFRHGDYVYALAMPGQFYRSKDGFAPFEEGPLLFNRHMRHSALLLRGDLLYVFWSQRGDAPERIYVSTIDLKGDWMNWRESEPVEVLRPEYSWEGADAPLVPSKGSTAYGVVNELRDPAIYEEDGRIFLLYAVGGEAGIALAEVFL